MTDSAPRPFSGSLPFSLVELILILTLAITTLAILGPIVYKKSAARRQVACQANLKEIGLGMSQYMADYTERVVPAYETGWVNKIASLRGETVDPTAAPKGIWRCPSQSFKSGDTSVSASDWWHGSNYGINQHLGSNLRNSSGEHYPEWAQGVLRQIYDPSGKLMVADASGSNYFGRHDMDTTVAGLSRTARTYADATGSGPASPFPSLRHAGNTGNFLFFDQHVANVGEFPEFTLAPFSRGYMFWHAEHAYPGSGKTAPKVDLAPAASAAAAAKEAEAKAAANPATP